MGSCVLRSDDTDASSTRLGASVRRHRSRLIPGCFGRSDRSRLIPGGGIIPEERGAKVRSAAQFGRRWSRSRVRVLGEAEWRLNLGASALNFTSRGEYRGKRVKAGCTRSAATGKLADDLRSQRAPDAFRIAAAGGKAPRAVPEGRKRQRTTGARGPPGRRHGPNLGRFRCISRTGRRASMGRSWMASGRFMKGS